MASSQTNMQTSCNYSSKLAANRRLSPPNSILIWLIDQNLFMHIVPYSVLQAEECRIRSDSSLRSPAAFQVHTAAAGHEVTTLLCTQQLAADLDAAGAVVLAADDLVRCCKLVPGTPAAAKAVSGSCSSRQLTLQGSSTVTTVSSKWQAIATRVHTPIVRPHWQLQPTFTVPSLRHAWPSQHRPWGAFTSAAVLLDTAQHSTPQHTQQLQALAPAGAAGTDPLQLLSAAAAGLLAAGGIAPEGTSQHSSSTVAAVSNPIHCTSTLYAALCTTLQQQQQQQQTGRQLSRGASSVTTPAQPAALILAGTSSGQVWVCDPAALLQDPRQPAGFPQPAVKLLFDLQQTVVAVLPVNLAAGTDALLLVGSLGRVVLVRQKQQQAAGLTARQQLQLPFQVAAAAVVAAGSSRLAGRQPQAGNPTHSMLLLLSASGHLYGASLHSVGAQPAAAAAAGAEVQAGHAAAVVTPGVLPLQPVQVQLPAAACRLWTVKQQPSSSNTAAALSRTSGSAAVCRIHSSIVLQLTGSCQLLEVSVQDIQAAITAAAGPLDTSAQLVSTAVPGSSTPAAATAAAAVQTARQQLDQLLAALETLAAAKQVLEQAAWQQEAHLQGMQQETKLLGLLQQHQQQQQQGLHSSSAQQQQQQQQRSLLAAASGTATNSQGKAAPRCSIHLHGLCPVLGAASALEPSSSIHLALSVQLQQPARAGGSSSSSSSQGFTGRLGPGWQLVVSFVPESADSSSVQTTVDINSDRSSSSSSSGADGGGLQASLMLRLPARCAALQEGGWVVLYAVKQSPLSAHSLADFWPSTANSTTTASLARRNHQQQQLHAQGSAPLHQSLPPVVTLLGHQYVGVMQLSAMVSANPAAQAAVKSAGSLRSQQAMSSQAGSSTGSSATPAYSCLLQLSATASADAGAAFDTAAAAAHAGVKRARHDSTAPAAAAAAGSAGQAPQQHADSTADGSAGALALQDWLRRALCLNPGHSAGTPPPLASSAHWDPFGGLPTVPSSSNAVSGRSRGSLQAEDGSAGVLPPVARQGQAVLVLGGGELGRATWGLSTAGEEGPSVALLDAAAGGVLRSAVEGPGAASLSVQLHAGRVPTLAGMHRAVLLDLLQQLQEAGGSWRMVSSVPQLKLAAARLRQLHQQLLKLQDSAGEAQDLLAADRQADTVGQLEQGLCAAYGRFLLAVGDAVQVAL